MCTGKIMCRKNCVCRKKLKCKEKISMKKSITQKKPKCDKKIITKISSVQMLAEHLNCRKKKLKFLACTTSMENVILNKQSNDVITLIHIKSY